METLLSLSRQFVVRLHSSLTSQRLTLRFCVDIIHGSLALLFAQSVFGFWPIRAGSQPPPPWTDFIITSPVRTSVTLRPHPPSRRDSSFRGARVKGEFARGDPVHAEEGDRESPFATS